jgi:type II secretory pathway pseudopilin PulG
MRKNIGMTILEVLIAIVITGIILASMLEGMNFANQYNQHNANKTMALNFAQELMEKIKNKAYDDLHATDSNYHTGTYTNFLGPEMGDNSPYTQDDDDNNPENGVITENEFDDVDDYNGYHDTVNIYQNENLSIAATRSVVIKDQAGNSVLDHAGFVNVSYKEITVSVSWLWAGSNYNESISTIVTYWKNEA